MASRVDNLSIIESETIQFEERGERKSTRLSHIVQMIKPISNTRMYCYGNAF
jgi:hypothetical protein